MNVAVVVLDTLRYDAFREQFGWLQGARFENAWSTGRWTIPAHASLFTGKYPSELGVHAGNQMLDCPELTLAEQLGEAGYTTRAFSSNVNISKAFDFHRGFDTFEGSWRLEALSEDVFDWGGFVFETRDTGPRRYLMAVQNCISGECATWPSLKRGAVLKLRDLGFKSRPMDDGATEALNYIRQTTFGNREFLFLNLMEAHGPYAPPKEYQTVEGTEPLSTLTAYNGLVATITGGPGVNPKLLRQAYDDSVRYLSDMYERIYDMLSDDFDIIVTLSDHGELFGEHGAWQHAYGVYPELTHVPLVISGETIDEETYEEVVSLLDVHRTVLDLADVSDSEHPDGNTFLATPRESSIEDITLDPTSRPCAVEHHGVYHRDWERAKAAGYDPAPFDRELFGVAVPPSFYGYETIDGFSSSDGADQGTLQETLKEHRERINRRETNGPVEVSGAVQRQLKDLGYG